MELCLRMRCLISRCARIFWIHVGESLTQWCFWDFVKWYQIISYLGIKGIKGISWAYISHNFGKIWAYHGHFFGLIWAQILDILGISVVYLGHLLSISLAWLVVKIFVQIVVIASPNASSVSIFSFFLNESKYCLR